jgi:hypothetical protein
LKTPTVLIINVKGNYAVSQRAFRLNIDRELNAPCKTTPVILEGTSTEFPAVRIFIRIMDGCHERSAADGVHLLVVGAGLAGLSAAIATKVANSANQVTILEAVRELQEVGVRIPTTRNGDYLAFHAQCISQLTPPRLDCN